jgi:transketolase
VCADARVAKSGHLDSSSAADIVAALYYRVLRHDPSNLKWPERDRFVLSKGHAARSSTRRSPSTAISRPTT